MSSSPIKRCRSIAKTYYHYILTNCDTAEKEYFKTLSQITAKYEISRSNIYLMIKNPETVRRKYNDIKIEKIHLHYLVVEQNIDPALIL